MKLHIDQQFGVYTQLLTDDSDPDHPLEIAVIPPRPEHDYYTLVTVGLSRHRMGFPEERREEKLERAELLINLPRDWKLTKVDCREELWSWPIRMMLATAHFAMEDPEVGLESRTTLMEGEDGIPLQRIRTCGARSCSVPVCLGGVLFLPPAGRGTKSTSIR